MRHRVLFLAVTAAAVMLLLTACTSSDQGIGQDIVSGSYGNAGPDASGSGGEGVTQPSAGQDSGTVQDQDPVENGSADGGGQMQPEEPGQEGNTAPVQTEGSEGDQTETPDGSQTEADSQESTGETGASEDIWSGTYASEQETVTITYTDTQSFAFSFANSGIASTAEVNGSQAVYRGDDHHVVIFEISGDILNITVSSEEDFDASGSPLNGTYVRQ